MSNEIYKEDLYTSKENSKRDTLTILISLAYLRDVGSLFVRCAHVYIYIYTCI